MRRLIGGVVYRRRRCCFSKACQGSSVIIIVDGLLTAVVPPTTQNERMQKKAVVPTCRKIRLKIWNEVFVSNISLIINLLVSVVCDPTTFSRLSPHIFGVAFGFKVLHRIKKALLALLQSRGCCCLGGVVCCDY